MGDAVEDPPCSETIGMGGPGPGGGAGRARVRSAIFTVAGALLLAAMVVAQVLSGLRPQPVALTSVVVLLLAGTAIAFASAVHTFPRAMAAFTVAAATGYAAEWIGIRTGVPFGEYRYTDVLWPQAGGVPVIVALAWGGMGLAAQAVAGMLVPGTPRPADPPTGPISMATARWITRAQARSGPASPARLGPAFLVRIGVGALALTAWDLFLDPQMIRLGLWTWAHPGPYRGVPIGNFIGWLLVSLLVMALIGGILARPARRSTGLIVVYTVMTVMETVGFAAVFDPPDPLVAATGGICMGAFALLAWRRLAGERPAWRRPAWARR